MLMRYNTHLLLLNFQSLPCLLLVLGSPGVFFVSLKDIKEKLLHHFLFAFCFERILSKEIELFELTLARGNG